MLINNNDIFSLRLVYRTKEQNFLNVRQYRATSLAGLVDADIVQLFDPVADAISGASRLLQSNDVRYEGFGVRRIHATPSQESLEAPGTAEFGLNATNSLPLQVAALISLRAEEAPPKTRGRMYVGGIADEMFDHDTQEMTTAGIGHMNTLGAALVQTYVVTLGGTDILLEPVLRNKDFNLWFPITNFLARRYVATQRRRSRINGADDPIFT